MLPHPQIYDKPFIYRNSDFSNLCDNLFLIGFLTTREAYSEFRYEEKIGYIFYTRDATATSGREGDEGEAHSSSEHIFQTFL